MVLTPTLVLFLLLPIGFPGSRSYSSPDAAAIIERSVEANARDWKASPEFDCFERDKQAAGSTTTYQDLMILGSPYQRLVAVNGNPLSAQQSAQEQSKLDAEIARRRSESPQERAQRIAKFERDRKRDREMMDQMTNAFHFTLVGEQKLDSRDVYVLKATPRPDYQPPNMECQALRGMQGKLWIDRQTFQWVRVEARVIHPVAIEGFLAQVEPGTYFQLERMPVGNNIWLTKHFVMRSRAKVFFIFPHTSQEDDTYYGYQESQETAHRAANGGQ